MSPAARTAFARGDYMAVIGMSEADMTAPARLLLAQSYARIGADGRAATTANTAISDILDAPGWSDAEPAKGLSVLEKRALRIWLDRVDGANQRFNQARLELLRAAILGPASATAEEPVQLSGQLDEIRQRVADGRAAEVTRTRWYRWSNLIAGTLAAGLAAATGVLGATKGSLLAISILAFASAAITAFLTSLKPAEREKESKTRADTLGQLIEAIDLFDVDRPNDALDLLPAVREVHERLAVAEGHGKITPLVASPKSNPGRQTPQ